MYCTSIFSRVYGLIEVRYLPVILPAEAMEEQARYENRLHANVCKVLFYLSQGCFGALKVGQLFGAAVFCSTSCS